jgi:hypothetical protein
MRRNLVLSACVAVGLIFAEVAMAIEEPAFDVLEKAESMEIRHYPPVIVAETFVEGDMDSASNSGFRLIADYIFGNNQSPRTSAEAASEKIAMTAPVLVEPVARSQKIAMTAPVSIERQGDSKDLPSGMKEGPYWRVQFTMPSSYSMASLPKPLNPAVTLREIPGKRYAVLVFSGFAGEEKAQQKTDELRAWLKARNFSAIATPQLARYNPPWTLPFFRRNEILIEIAVP